MRTEKQKQASRESAKRWRLAHPEEQKAHNRKYYLKNREKRLAQMQEYHRRIMEKAKAFDQLSEEQEQEDGK